MMLPSSADIFLMISMSLTINTESITFMHVLSNESLYGVQITTQILAKKQKTQKKSKECQGLKDWNDSAFLKIKSKSHLWSELS